jgi:hypothetical protein
MVRMDRRKSLLLRDYQRSRHSGEARTTISRSILRLGLQNREEHR